MNRILLSVTLVAFVMNASASTCPDLEGVYNSCRSGEESALWEMKNVSIKQTESVNFTFSYEVDDAKETILIIGDGKPRFHVEKDPELASIPYTTTSHCKDNSLISTTSANILDVFEIIDTTILSLNNSGELVIEVFLDGDIIEKTICH